MGSWEFFPTVCLKRRLNFPDQIWKMQNKFVHGIPVLAVGDMTHMHVHFRCPDQYIKCTAPVQNLWLRDFFSWNILCCFELASHSFIELSFNPPAFPRLLNRNVCIYHIMNICYGNATGIRWEIIISVLLLHASRWGCILGWITSVFLAPFYDTSLLEILPACGTVLTVHKIFFPVSWKSSFIFWYLIELLLLCVVCLKPY